MSKQLNAAEIAGFFSQTALLIQAGITPLSAMEILLGDTKGKQGQKLISQIITSCKDGSFFYEALESTECFPSYCINLVKLGETSGNLDDCLTALADYYEKQENIKEGIKNAITYPFIMIAMMCVVVFVLLGKVLPIFSQVFAELGTQMTGIAGALLSLGQVINRYMVLFVILLALAFLLIYGCLNIPVLGNLAARFFAIFPLTKGFSEKYACQRFASGMAMTIASGIDTFTSLDMVSELVDQPAMREKIAKCKDDLRQGANLSEALVGTGIFSHVHSRMVTVGFKSGNIDIILKRIADSYEKETDKKLQNIISVLEPTLVIILSVIVGFILLSVILPLTGIMSSIG